MSIIGNAVAVIRGDKEIDEAGVAVVVDTGKAAVVGYGTSAAGSLIKSGMQNSTQEIVRQLSKTNLPALIVTTTLETGKVMKRYLSGEIDGTQCLVQLGEAGTSIAASGLGAAAFGATLGTVVGGPVGLIAGALVGAAVGQVMTTMFYKQLVGALKEAKLAREERLRIESECEEAIKAIRLYRAEMEAIIEFHLADLRETFNASLAEIHTALDLGDVDAFISGANVITEKFGGEVQFRNMSEFDEFMNNEKALVF